MNRRQRPPCIDTSSAPSGDKPRIRKQLLDRGPLRRVDSQTAAHEAPCIAHVPRRRLAQQALLQPLFQGPFPGRKLVKQVPCMRCVSASPLIVHHDVPDNSSPSASKYSAACAHRCKKCAGKGPRSASMHASCAALEPGTRCWCSSGTDPVSSRNVCVLVSLSAARETLCERVRLTLTPRAQTSAGYDQGWPSRCSGAITWGAVKIRVSALMLSARTAGSRQKVNVVGLLERATWTYCCRNR